MHPQNCFPERPSAACNLKKENPEWGNEFFTECFPDINEFVRSMGSEGNDRCSKVAIETVQGKGPEAETNHLYYNFKYYFNRTVNEFPQKEVMVIRQEKLWEDMRRIERILGGDPSWSFETQGQIVTHGSEKFRYKARLDESLIPVLCCVIPNEIFVYTNLLSRAINLAPPEKKFPISRLLFKCNARSLNDLAFQCGWRTNEFKL